jgi:hypothetical protein
MNKRGVMCAIALFWSGGSLAQEAYPYPDWPAVAKTGPTPQKGADEQNVSGGNKGEPSLLEVPGFTEGERNDVCVLLAEKFAINASKSFQSDLKKVVAISNICKEEWSNASDQTKLGIKAWYGALTGVLDASKEQLEQAQSKYCEGHYGEWWESKVTSAEAQTVSSDGADVIRTCLMMTKASILPTLMIANAGKEFSMSIQYKPDQPRSTVLKLFGPMDLEKNSCTGTKGDAEPVHLRTQKDIMQTLKSSESVTVTCTRQSDKITKEGVTYDCTPEVIFNVSTSGVVAPTKLPSVCVDELQKSRYDVLAARITTLEGDAKKYLSKDDFTTNYFDPFRKEVKDQIAGKVDASGFRLHPKGVSLDWGAAKRGACLNAFGGPVGGGASSVDPCTEGPQTTWTTIMGPPW